jgi:hypothetical protein
MIQVQRDLYILGIDRTFYMYFDITRLLWLKDGRVSRLAPDRRFILSKKSSYGSLHCTRTVECPYAYRQNAQGAADCRPFVNAWCTDNAADAHVHMTWMIYYDFWHLKTSIVICDMPIARVVAPHIIGMYDVTMHSWQWRIYDAFHKLSSFLHHF